MNGSLKAPVVLDDENWSPALMNPAIIRPSYAGRWQHYLYATLRQAFLYLDLSALADVELENYHTSRRGMESKPSIFPLLFVFIVVLAADFRELEVMAVVREKSCDRHHRPFYPSRRDMYQAGWAISADGTCAQCPHCHVEYQQWQPTDHPLDVHRALSPCCLFVLSPNPLNLPAIPIRTSEQQFPLAAISTAHLRRYNGLANVSTSKFFALKKRLESFDARPHLFANNKEDLTNAGFYYDESSSCIQCFYCRSFRMIRLSDGEIQMPSHRVQCFYDRQNQDLKSTPRHHQNSLTPVVSDQSNKSCCSWCMQEEKQVMAFPCGHRCLCQTCARRKRVCPRCDTRVDSYVRIY